MMTAARFWETSDFLDEEGLPLPNDAFFAHSEVIKKENKYFIEFFGIEKVCGSFGRIVRDQHFDNKLYR